VTADDSQGGRARVSKSLLVNSVPRVIRGPEVVTVGVGKRVEIRVIDNYFLDPDGDRLTLSMREKDELELKTYGLIL
jgi:hypothetical protein